MQDREPWQDAVAEAFRKARTEIQLTGDKDTDVESIREHISKIDDPIDYEPLTDELKQAHDIVAHISTYPNPTQLAYPYWYTYHEAQQIEPIINPTWSHYCHELALRIYADMAFSERS